MQNENTDSLNTLRDIRDIMERSARFISLSGWSGVWAGCVALAGSFIAKSWLNETPSHSLIKKPIPGESYDATISNFVLLATIVLIVALVGGYYFTWRKTRQQGGNIFNSASRRMVAQIAIPLVVGAIFSLNYLYNLHDGYVAPTFLVFYGLALINGSKYTLSDVKYLGFCEIILGCICLFLPGYGLIFWTIGFGVLHILYGLIMWNKYDRNIK